MLFSISKHSFPRIQGQLMPMTKSKIKTKNLYFKQYIQNGRFESDFVFLESLIIEINDLISSTKKLYYANLAKKLNNPLLQAKTFWSILKSFYNEKISQ